jgi:tetratricopeptide (TPR) repeat protein
LFPGYGIDVLALDPAEAAARIRASAIHQALLAGLDGWLQAKPRPDPDRAHLQQVAEAADGNAWRRAFREAALAADVPKLKALMGQPEAVAQPPAMLAWLGGWSVRHLGLQSEAAAVLRQVQQRHPADYWVNYNLGDALAVYGAPQQYRGEGLGYIRAAVATRPTSAYAHGILGGALFWEVGDTDAATCALQQALALDPKLSWVLDCLAFALRSKGDLNGAIACCQKAIEADPTNFEVRFHLGEMLQRQGRRDEAITCFKEAVAAGREVIRLNPDEPDRRRGFINVLRHHGLYKELEAEYREAIRLRPDDPVPHNDLAWLLATCPDPKLRDPKQAVEQAQKAVELAPNTGAFWNTLGVAQYRNGDWKAANEALMKSTQLRNGGDSCDFFFLAMAQWQLKEKDKARTWHDQAVAWMDKNSPQDEDLKRFRAEATALLGLAKADEAQEKKE